MPTKLRLCNEWNDKIKCNKRNILANENEDFEAN